MNDLINKVGGIFNTNNNGYLIITKYVNTKNVHIKFIKTGYEAVVRMSEIKKGTVKDRFLPSYCGVGFLGNELTKINGNTLKEYMLWSAMIKRCYDTSYPEKNPTYKNCEVSENFKNYSYFKHWCSNQIGFNRKGWDLDKDLLIKGNKTYSEESCVFIPQEINVILNNGRRGREYPLGVGYDKRIKKFESRLCINGKQMRIGRFKTIDEASDAYKKAKEEQIKVVAQRWKGEIDERIYDILMSYRVYLNNS